jgi:type I restriction enzyme S subunit
MGFIAKEPAEFVSPASYDTWMTRGIPKRGDVLFTTEAPLGNVAQLDTDDRVVFAQRVIVMQPDPSALDSTFLKFMLLSAPVQAKIHAQATGATAQGIKASRLKRIELNFPKAVGEQRRLAKTFVALSGEVESLRGLCDRKLIALDELKKSLLHQAFTGKLTSKATDKQLAAVP